MTREEERQKTNTKKKDEKGLTFKLLNSAFIFHFLSAIVCYLVLLLISM